MLRILFALILMTSVAKADYTLVVPQKPSGGTSVWSQIVVAEWEKHLGEKIILKYLPGARDQMGPNQFQNEFRFDDKTILVSHGGNGISYLIEPVEYNYFDWDSIGHMNLNIIVGADDTIANGHVKFSAGSGMIPEIMAITMLMGGPDMDPYEAFNKYITFVKGMSGSERRLAFRRGDLNATRENPAAYKKHVMPLIEKGVAETWFHHGILDVESGKHIDDPNFTEPTFEKLYTYTYGVEPSGDFYDAYKLVKSWRDSLQKAFWVNKNNPNKQKLIDALNKMIADPDSVAAIEKKVGKYEWRVGEDGNDTVKILKSFITPEALKTLVDFTNIELGYNTVYKEDLTK
tara:strand:+ start:1007 stop:2044 length:1038 start_codon:yes stop_codon:yes gene_type:complete